MPEDTSVDVATALDSLRQEFYEYRASLAKILQAMLDALPEPVDPKETAAEIARSLNERGGQQPSGQADQETAHQMIASLRAIDEHVQVLSRNVDALQGIKGMILESLPLPVDPKRTATEIAEILEPLIASAPGGGTGEVAERIAMGLRDIDDRFRELSASVTPSTAPQTDVLAALDSLAETQAAHREAATEELHRALDRFRAEIVASLGPDTDAFGRAERLLELLHGSVGALSERFQAGGEDGARIERLLTELSERFDSGSQDGARIERSLESLNATQSAQRQAASEELARAMEKVRSDVIASLGSIGEAVGVRADRWLTSFDGTVEALQERIEQLASLVDSSTASVQGVVRTNVEDLSGPVQELVRMTRALDGTVQQTPAQIATLTQRLAELVNVVEEVRDKEFDTGSLASQEVVVALGREIVALKDDVRSLAERTEQPLRSLLERSTASVHDVREFSERATQELAARTDALGASVEAGNTDQSERADALRARLDRMSERLLARSDEIAATIANLNLVESLNALAQRTEASARAASEESNERSGEIARRLSVAVSGLDQIWNRLDALDTQLRHIADRVDRIAKTPGRSKRMFGRKVKAAEPLAVAQDLQIAVPSPLPEVPVEEEIPVQEPADEPDAIFAPVKKRPRVQKQRTPAARSKQAKPTPKPRTSTTKKSKAPPDA